MKTLILYATKHGAAGEIAKRIASQMDGAITHDLKQGGIPSLGDFDCVIIGSALYAGMICKEAKVFVEQNTSALCGKKFALFISGLDGSKEKEYFATNYSSEVLRAAMATAFLGGIFDPKKAGVLGRIIMKAVAKQSAYTDTIDDAKILRFVGELQK